MIALPVLPLLTCLIASVLQCLFWSFPIIRKVLHILSGVFLLGVVVAVFQGVWHEEYLVMQASNIPFPFGITFIIDHFSAIMLLLAAGLGLVVAIYSLIDEGATQYAKSFYPVYWMLMAGICGAFSTGDLFNLYVWFEVMLISSFVLMALGGHKIQLDGTLKYLALNLISTILMLSAIGLLYGITGTLNLAEMSVKISQMPISGVITAIAALLSLAFGIKAAVFPLFFWLPASYHTTSVSASAIFAGMMTKVGVYALVRVFTLLFIQESYFLHPLLMGCAALTMLTGVLGAASQHQFRRILAFHSISQIGYIIMGLAIFTPLAIAAAIFFIAHHSLVKTNLFLISGIIHRMRGYFDLNHLGGLYRSAPILSLLFFISAFSLAGFPPLSGFWGKLLLIKEAFVNTHITIAVIALVVSFLTLYSMTKIWNLAFWKSDHQQETHHHIMTLKEKSFSLCSVFLLTILILIVSFMPAILFDATDKASKQLLNQAGYIEAVSKGLR